MEMGLRDALVFVTCEKEGGIHRLAPILIGQDLLHGVFTPSPLPVGTCLRKKCNLQVSHARWQKARDACSS